MAKTLQRLVIRAVAAAAAGVAAQMVRSMVRPVRAEGRKVAKHGPEAEEWMQAVTHRAMEWMRDSDAPEAVWKFCARVLNSAEPEGKAAGKSRFIDIGRSRSKGFWHRSK
jgi:hypothetical protein